MTAAETSLPAPGYHSLFWDTCPKAALYQQHWATPSEGQSTCARSWTARYWLPPSTWSGRGVVVTIASLSQDLCGFAVELRKLAYTMPGGHEDPLLRLSERMVRHAQVQAADSRV